MDQITQAQTLFMAIKDWQVESPRILIIGGTSSCLEHLPKNANCQIWQPFYPYTQNIKPYLIDTIDNLEPVYDYVFILPTKQKEETFGYIANGFSALKENGLLVISAANNAGGQRLQKIFKNLGCDTQHISKNHAKTLWTKKQSEALNTAQILQWQESAKIQKPPSLSLLTQPGIFGWNKVDKGSKLLSQFLPNDIKGDVADFGCGYGFLSAKLLNQNNNIDSIWCIDADQRSPQICARNLQEINNLRESNRTTIKPLWTDITDKKNVPHNAFKTIIMNAPFHEGKKADNNIGQNFIRTASHAIKLGGTLYMVANRQLPYEIILDKNFKKIELLTEENGFKCYKAIK